MRTCATSGCGCQTYSSCRTSGCGCETYASCRTSSCGCETWKWGIKTFTIAKNYLELRHKLIPYLYNEAYKYYKDGVPVMRPVFYYAPEMYDDVNYRYEYFLGSELFISPIITQKDFVMLN